MLYNKIKTKPSEIKIEILNDTYYFRCNNYSLSYVNFNKIAKQLSRGGFIFQYVTFTNIIKDLGIHVVGKQHLITEQWCLCKIDVTGGNIVLFADNYTTKIRVNFEKTESDKGAYIERCDVQTNSVVFYADYEINKRYEKLKEKRKKLDSEIHRLEQYMKTL